MILQRTVTVNVRKGQLRHGNMAGKRWITGRFQKRVAGASKVALFAYTGL